MIATLYEVNHHDISPELTYALTYSLARTCFGPNAELISPDADDFNMRRWYIRTPEETQFLVASDQLLEVLIALVIRAQERALERGQEGQDTYAAGYRAGWDAAKGVGYSYYQTRVRPARFLDEDAR